MMLDGNTSPHCKRGTAASPLVSAHVYCGHSRPSHLLLGSCTIARPKMLCCTRVKVSLHILALLFDLLSVLRDNSLSITEHFQPETENASIRATTNIVRRHCGVSVILVKFDAVMQEMCPKLYGKYSAVDGIGDRLAKIDTCRKLGVGCCASYRGGTGFPSNIVAWAEAYIRTMWHLDMHLHCNK